MKKMSLKVFVAYLLIATSWLFATSTLAYVELPGIFGNNMVLQRGVQVPVWGWADSGEKVTVSFVSQVKTTTADKNGNWSVKLEPMKADKNPREIIVSGKNTIKFNNVLVGDVWIASGQSNMAFSLWGR